MVCAHAKSSPYAIWAQASPGGASFCLFPSFFCNQCCRKLSLPKTLPPRYSEETSRTLSQSCGWCLVKEGKGPGHCQAREARMTATTVTGSFVPLVPKLALRVLPHDLRTKRVGVCPIGSSCFRKMSESDREGLWLWPRPFHGTRWEWQKGAATATRFRKQEARR